MSVSTLPQVSLISSWFIPPLDQWKKNEHLPALSHALEQQILLHDLYFLHPADIAWYARAAGMPDATPETPLTESPLDFVSELTSGQLDNIAKALTQYLADNYKGRLIGPRPRFTALATYWPSINTPDLGSPCPESSFRCRRARSVKAVRNSLYLAMKLGWGWPVSLSAAGLIHLALLGVLYRFLRSRASIRPFEATSAELRRDIDALGGYTRRSQ